MECILPELTRDQNIRIQEILEETNYVKTEAFSPDICKIQKSKKNLVLSIQPQDQSPFILKLFTSPKSLENEKSIYTKAQDTLFFKSDFPRSTVYAIPEILHNGEDYIITELIQGVNIMDLITRDITDTWDPTRWEPLLTDLIQWIIEFSKIYHVIPLDCHVRNFIMRNTTLYGVDFEELGKSNENNLLRVYATLYFSILASSPGIIEGLELEKKINLGVLFLRRILLSPFFQDQTLYHIVTKFLDYLQSEAAIVIQRRITLERGKEYDTIEIKKRLDLIVSQIQSDFT